VAGAKLPFNNPARRSEAVHFEPQTPLLFPGMPRMRVAGHEADPAAEGRSSASRRGANMLRRFVMPFSVCDFDKAKTPALLSRGFKDLIF
jgi:hypothetical protein